MIHYQNMNARNREIALCYAFARYGRRCYHCNITLQDLITEAEIKETLTQTPRKLPVILVENLTIGTIKIRVAPKSKNIPQTKITKLLT